MNLKAHSVHSLHFLNIYCHRKHGFEDPLVLWHKLFYYTLHVSNMGILSLISSWIIWLTEILWTQSTKKSTSGCRATSPDLHAFRVEGCKLGVDLPSTASSHHDDTDRGSHSCTLWTLTQTKAGRHTLHKACVTTRSSLRGEHLYSLCQGHHISHNSQMNRATLP